MGKNANVSVNDEKTNFIINIQSLFRIMLTSLRNKWCGKIRARNVSETSCLLLIGESREMNTLKAIHDRFPLTKPTHIQPGKSNSRRRSSICFSNSDVSDSNTSIPEGDKRKQELLAQIAMLQAQKVRLTNFLDERSSNLTQFAEDANAEFDAIGENALKELDDAGARIMEKLESRMQAFEETAEVKRQEIESNEKLLEEFQEQIARDKNEGLFFKNLRKKTPQKTAEAKEEARKLSQLIKDSSRSRTRRNIYLALMLLLLLAVGNAVYNSPEVEWRKVWALLLILFGLLAQFIYEQSMSAATTDETKKENETVQDEE